MRNTVRRPTAEQMWIARLLDAACADKRGLDRSGNPIRLPRSHPTCAARPFGSTASEEQGIEVPAARADNRKDQSVSTSVEA